MLLYICERKPIEVVRPTSPAESVHSAKSDDIAGATAPAAAGYGIAPSELSAAGM